MTTPDDPTDAETGAAEPHEEAVGRATDLAAGLVLCGLSLFAIAWLIPNYTQPADSNFDVAPGFFPRLAAGVVLVLSLGMIGHRLLRMAATPGAASGVAAVAEFVAWCVIAAGLYLLLVHVGFLAMAFAAIALGSILSGSRNWPVIAALTVLLPLAVDWGAWLVFTVDLP